MLYTLIEPTLKKVIYILLLIIILSSMGCKSYKFKSKLITDNSFCITADKLISRLKNDKKALDHFGISRTNVYIDAAVKIGIPHFFYLDYSKYKARTDTFSPEEIYSELLDYEYANVGMRLNSTCLSSGIKNINNNIKLEFWFHEVDKLITLSASNILKKPGYSIGYLYLFKDMGNGEIELISETSWEE